MVDDEFDYTGRNLTVGAPGTFYSHRLRDFLRWAHTRGLAGDLEVHWLGRYGLAEQVLGDDER